MLDLERGCGCICSKNFLLLLALITCVPISFRQYFSRTLSRMQKATPKVKFIYFFEIQLADNPLANVDKGHFKTDKLLDQQFKIS